MALKRKADREQGMWLAAIGSHRFRGCAVVDVGCGAGSFLDHVAHLADSTTGVEVSSTLGSVLSDSGHCHVESLSELSDEAADAVVSFDTLEHVPEPANMLADVRRVLKPGGTVYIGVPNQNDCLKRLVPTYLAHFYHTSHLWYFSSRRLAALLHETGFAEVTIEGLHKYDVMNLVTWARDGVGRGVVGSDVFDLHTEAAFRRELERQLISSHLLARGVATPR